MKFPKMQIQTAGGCAWRALYLSLNGRQIAHIGVDPNNGVTPQLFGGFRWKSFRLPLPTLRWKWPCSGVRMFAYRMVHQFWFNVDGRYGWGGSQKKARLS